MNLQELNKIGLTQGEIKLYQALLELGETTRTKLAKKSGISPSKIYDVANRLLEKGIISSVKKNGIIHFSAANPSKINDFISNKEKEITDEKTIVSQLMPFLLSQYGKTKDEANIEVFSGWEGMKTVYWDLGNSLGKNDENYVFGASQGKDSKRADIFFNDFYKEFKNKGYKVKIIFNESLRKNKERTNPYTKNKRQEVRFIDQETFVEIELYKNTVLFVMLLEKPIVIRIKSKEAADSFKVYFDALWKIAKP